MFPQPKPPAEPDIPLIDNVFAPEMLASGVAGLSILNGIVTLTLESARCDHSTPAARMERFVIGRVAVPIVAAQTLLLGLHQLLGQHGLSPIGVPQETCQ